MNFAIIAAGEGSRLVNEGVEISKPLVDIDGQPMIGRLLNIFARCGGRRIVVCINDFMTDVKGYLDAFRFDALEHDKDIEIKVLVKTTPSSMHTMWEVAREMKGHGRWIATTVDTIFRENDFLPYVDSWVNAPCRVDAMMAVTDFVDDEKPLWVAVDEHSRRITGFYDDNPGCARYVSGGIYGFSDSTIDVLENAMKTGIFRMRNYQRSLLVAGLTVEAFPMGKIVDVDHAADIFKANEFLNS